MKLNVQHTTRIFIFLFMYVIPLGQIVRGNDNSRPDMIAQINHPCSITGDTLDQGNNPSSTQDPAFSRPRMINGIAVPADFPSISPEINKATAPGYLFLNNYKGNPYMLILTNDGTPYFYQRTEDPAVEFKVNPNGVLSRRIKGDTDGYQTLDSHYQVLHTWKCTDGYDTDDHEFHYTARNTAMMIGLDYRIVDLSDSVEGGKHSVVVRDNIIQELNLRDSVVFEWSAWDHFSIHEAEDQNLSTSFVDPFHINSIAEDRDGNILISCRYLNQCLKINKETGEIIWRLGGKKGQFDFINDEGFSYQHDFRPVPGVPGHYTLFDNGNLKVPEAYSRAVEYKLDTVSMTAEKVWEFIPSPHVFAPWMGNVQRLPNGNTLINLAEEDLPKAIEVTPEGEVVYRTNFSRPSTCYRVFRFEWEGMLDKPGLVVEQYPDLISLIFNKFGDKTLTGYHIYLDTSPGSTVPFRFTKNNWINISSGDVQNNSWYYVRVSAVYNDGSESAASEEKKIFVSFRPAGSNLIRNGSFDLTDEFWQLNRSSNVSATGSAEAGGGYQFTIGEGGINYSDIQLRQDSLVLEAGCEYTFEFDARSESPRLIEAIIESGMNPALDVGKIGPTYITAQEKHYSYTFTMNELTDFNARVVVNCGRSDADVYIDNLSLKKTAGPDTITSASEKLRDETFTVYPNPVISGELHLRCFCSGHHRLSATLFRVTGEVIMFRDIDGLTGGWNDLTISVKDIPAGIYLLKLSSTSPADIVAYKKIIIH